MLTSWHTLSRARVRVCSAWPLTATCTCPLALTLANTFRSSTQCTNAPRPPLTQHAATSERKRAEARRPAGRQSLAPPSHAERRREGGRRPAQSERRRERRERHRRQAQSDGRASERLASKGTHTHTRAHARTVALTCTRTRRALRNCTRNLLCLLRSPPLLSCGPHAMPLQLSSIPPAHRSAAPRCHAALDVVVS